MTRQHYRSLGWFILINALFATLIAARYFEFYPDNSFTPLSVTFAVTSAVGQMSLLTAVIGLLFIPVIYIAHTHLRRSLWALGAALGLTLLFIDTIVFAQYRFHINAVVVGLIMAGDIVSFPLVTWLMAIGGFLAVLLAELVIISVLETRLPRVKSKLGRKVGGAIFVTLLAANLIHVWGVAHANQPVSMVTRYLPLYYPATANSLLKKMGLVDLDALENQKNLKMNNKGDLNYPLTPLKGEAPEHPKDIMFIVLDSWRYDTFTAEVSPNLWQLAQQGVVYQNHISTGNATRTGIFGLFYGIPGTYWHAFLANQRPAALIDCLQQLDYQLGIFTSAQLIKPEFNLTVFRNVPDLRIRSEGETPADKDRNLTDDWKSWYEKADHSKPAFSFLFYDAIHDYDFPKDYSPKFEPMMEELNYLSLNNDTDPTPLFNRYKTSVHYVDGLVQEVISTLKAKGRLDDTLIVITGDHGQELNDNKLNFWGHNGNFTDPQVKVPFIIVGAGARDHANPEYQNSFTSHEDVVPTIMRNYLGVTNDMGDYSTGDDLYGKFVKRDWLISSKYSGYGIITKDTILEVNSAGGYEMLDKTNRPVDKPLNTEQMKSVLERISRYLQ